MTVVKKSFVFVFVMLVSVFFSLTILLGIGFLSPEALVLYFAPEGSKARALVPEDIDFRAEQLENAQQTPSQSKETEGEAGIE